jgi:opacity protein-like surface antigen
MKKLSAVLFVLLFAGAAFSQAQVIPGKFELGTSVTYFNLKFDSDTSSMSYLNIPVRFGWYFWQGLEIEPEVEVFIPMGSTSEDTDTTYFFQGKLLYNFRMPGGVEPFIGGGAGVGNGIPFFGVVEGGKDYKTFTYMGLAGIKFRLGNSAAIRVEYRFNRFSWQVPLFEKEWGNLHRILVGISVFL